MSNKQADEAAALAEELHAQMYSTKEPDSVEEVQDDEAAQQGPEQSDTPVEEEKQVEAKEDFEAKYKSLQGKYNAEVPRLSSELRELKEKVFERLGDQAKQVSQDAPEPKKEAVSNEKLIKFAEEYGEELPDYVTELINIRVADLLKDQLKPVTDKVDSVEDTQVKAAQKEFAGYLDATVKGDWQAAMSGEDEKFNEFLSKPDPSGLYTYGELVTNYNNNWDNERLAKVFNLYYGDTQVATTQPKPQSKEKEALVAPSRSTQHTTPSPDEKTIWTAASMEEFQKKDRMGKYDTATSKAMWDDLLLASVEGRIRN